MSPSCIEAIETKNLMDQTECCRNVMTDWLRNNHEKYSATWNGLIELLKDMEFSTLATQVEEYLKSK